MLNRIIKYFLDNRVITLLLLVIIIVWGLSTAPFNWHGGVLPRDPVPVDAIPDIGENQQIVATEWMGRSPKDIQEQITYPLSTSLLGIPGVKTIRSTSMFGMSFIYIIFDDNIEFYWSRSRVLEKLNSLPAGTLPVGVQPSLGPDATALGQIFWYTLEGRNPETGEPTGGWNPDELRTIQDFYAKYSISAAEGVSEVASIGGFVKEYQVEINPNAMRAFNVSIMDVMNAVQKSNLDIGAETVEINKAEYLVRGLGYIKNVSDLEEAVITVRNGVPVKIKDVAFVNLGPATRRGGLDKEGVEAVGGVVVARYGSNPMQVIDNVKAKIQEMEAGLPQKTLADGTVSKVTVVPFYDRSGLIQETIGTLETALSHEILICIIVVIVLVFNLRASVVISAMLPITVLATFIIMRYTGVEANIVALSGIAIAIGVMVDVGVVFVENIIRHMEMPENKGITKGKAFVNLIHKSVSEVSGAITTAMLTTVVSFLPVFAMQAQEGKLFHPLAFTKTFALVSALILGLSLLPTLAYFAFSIKITSAQVRKTANIILIAAGILLFIFTGVFAALALTLFGLNNFLANRWTNKKIPTYINIGIAILVAVYYLTVEWLPIGPQEGFFLNLIFVLVAISVILALLWILVIYYERILRWCLAHRWKFMLIPLVTVFFGIMIWLGFDTTFGFVAKGFEAVGWKNFRQTAFWQASSERFPGIGEEFMPSLNEGSFLLMPTSMPHTGIEQNLQFIETLDKRISNIPEVDITVGKWGRVNSALDPAPTQMFENTIIYRSEYILDENGHRQRFKVNRNGEFLLKGGGTYNPEDGFRLLPADSLITDSKGDYFRQWRPHIKKTDDIWQEIVNVSHMPGLTSSPKLQPIEARLVMLSTGMRAPMGLKVSGPDLESIEQGGKALETALKDIPSILPSTVFYDRAVGAPYIEIKLNRRNMARYGITVADLQDVISASVGGMPLTTTVEGRERFPVRLRYPRELRDNPDELAKLIVPTATGAQIPLKEVADIEYTKGAQMIQSENTFLLGYVIFDKVAGKAEVDVVKEADKILREKISSGQLELPKGVSYKFAGNYEQQERAAKRLLVVVPLCLLAILLILYFQFKTVTASLIHFSGVFVAFSGGFILLWLYGEPWFMNFSVGDMNMRDLFQMHPINLSIAVWVGFIALFGIATDDGVLMGTYIHDTFLERNPQTKDEIREAVVHAGLKRVRPAAMTTATSLIALLPVLTSTGKGADIMIPMAIPTFGGMLIQSMTMFVVPILQCWWRESAIKKHGNIKE
ncbi:efflux RND transporter permease subunit [Bacteroides ovatus]|jgi:cation efflux system transmembrane protein|uniref:efflux RND transporter permease subunit n=1 Tax=Bacteroides ovatus TaxID=28116 RepID=UPI00189B6882|nr:efflux RND transporter permease subunit [Bacteroides ovatus]MDC2624397.1 efflux RND transporter permease subunit [Bacteroides ovatus]MDC2638314.1 efflux RND transporter permease subunit [Bacteroides ovatus]MDC2652835.1 efflux RND transporter permease subunit [Bacteroides ovatus]